jgi:tetratricopeptide (TPR) repeat protein
MLERKIIILILALLLSAATKGQRIDNLQRSGEGITQQEYFYAFTEATKYYLFGNYVQAVGLFKECLKLRPESSAVHFQLSKIFLNTGNIDLAREHAKMAIVHDAKNKWYLQALVDIYQMEQKYDSAVLVYKQLLQLEEDNVNILFGIASLHEKLKQYEQALPFLDAIDDKIGVSKEVSINRYRLYEAMNQPNEAINHLKVAEGLSDDEYAITGMIAEFYRRQNKPDSATKYYAEIYPKYKFDPTVAFSYADFLIERERMDSARDIFTIFCRMRMNLIP